MLQVLPIALGIINGRFEDHGKVLREAGIGEEGAEALITNGALPDMGMVVPLASKAKLAVVGMDDLKPLKADRLAKLIPYSLGVADKIVACIVDMTGIQADNKALGLGHTGEDRREVLKDASQGGALGRGCLQRYFHVEARTARVDNI